MLDAAMETGQLHSSGIPRSNTHGDQSLVLRPCRLVYKCTAVYSVFFLTKRNLK
jgi:hypothetical protein